MRGVIFGVSVPLCLAALLQLSVGTMAQTGDDGDTKPPDVPDYWPELASDLPQVSWSHATNSRDKENEALSGDINMLEADVSIDRDGQTPIMAHPPAITSDLTLEQFLQALQAAIGQGKRKGTKLDFKTTAAFERALPVLEEFDQRGDLNFPVWLNADIAAGPGGALLPSVNPSRFLALSQEHFPGRRLSLGWTTGPLGRSYNDRHVRNMREALQAANVSTSYPLTFALRAGPAARSADTLLPLLQDLPGATFTFWASQGDQVDKDALLQLAKDAGFDRVYVDLPFNVPGLTRNSTEKSSNGTTNKNSGGGGGFPGSGVVRAILSPFVALFTLLQTAINAVVQHL